MTAIGQDIYGARPGRAAGVRAARAGPARQLRRTAGRRPTGKVLGMVFAASREDPDTGYALTAKQVSDAASSGRDEVDDVPPVVCT